ncbi:unnamed protein product [Rotaria magnacalcarata]|uniref:GATA-type domain-containing protein n=2 Tax=Rotaria magnacalcarata TaxID=392030 RepID=A0A819LXX3_9BILA|nr:unnamed protein product [Rotaria magnacalcarata]CAF2062026.1 unnamed protein product [Rotaria magnacalcarata]CAF3968785.1 unnamed protein product [Rotaria magnacalcarata]CAF4033216.1 unnamed protein product [Rotaria magnacalcarata]
MSLKRPLSPELNINSINNTVRQSKRLKLHSIIQKLQNEEACLVLLKKLRTNQQLSTQKINQTKTVTNGYHPIEKHSVIPSTQSVQILTTTYNIPTSSQQQQQLSLPAAIRKSSNSPLLTTITKASKSPSFEEYKTQAKLALRKQLEHDLLNISLPKPSLQDVVFVPNGTSLEFQLFLGLEDAIQCLNELQASRQRAPQRFTDQASTDQPYVCGQCGTDFTIRWWKHINPKLSNETISILCDRCKKQVTRRASKSDHSASLKNVFLSAMKQEKEIDKHFTTLTKQHKTSSRLSSTKPVTTNAPQMHSKSIATTNILSNNHQYQAIKMKNPSSQNFTSKLPQQLASGINAMRKSTANVQSGVNSSTMKHGNNSRTVQISKTPLPIHHQQQFRSVNSLPQSTKVNQSFKVSKHTMKKETIMPPPRSVLPPNPDLLHAFLSSNLFKPTATKRSTLSKFKNN